MIYEHGEPLWNNTDWVKTEELREKLDPVPLRAPQIPYGLIWVQTQACMMKGQRNDYLSHGTGILIIIIAINNIIRRLSLFWLLASCGSGQYC
jgi:hypothetical protein